MVNQIPHLEDDLLNEYLDGTLPPDQVAVVEAHLQGCEPCQAALASLQTLFSHLESLEDLPLGRDLAPQVLNRLPVPVVPEWPVRWLTVIQVIIAAAVLMFSWPLMAPLTQAINIPKLPVSQWLASWQIAISTNWAGWSQTINLLLDQALSGFIPSGLLRWSGFNIWPWVAVLGMVWLIVNGWVLRPMFPRQRNGI